MPGTFQHFNPPRRIVTINVPLPSALSTEPRHVEPAVMIVDAPLKPTPELGGATARHTVFVHDKVPTSNSGSDITPKELTTGIVASDGVNVRYNDLPPHSCVPWHRTTSTDYNVFLHGSPVLLTPKSPFSGDKPPASEVQETICNPGDVCLQRGTLHAWENRTDEWIRWISIILGSEPNTIEVEGGDDRKTLNDAWVPYEM